MFYNIKIKYYIFIVNFFYIKSIIIIIKNSKFIKISRISLKYDSTY